MTKQLLINFSPKSAAGRGVTGDFCSLSVIPPRLLTQRRPIMVKFPPATIRVRLAPYSRRDNWPASQPDKRPSLANYAALQTPN